METNTKKVSKQCYNIPILNIKLIKAAKLVINNSFEKWHYKFWLKVFVCLFSFSLYCFEQTDRDIIQSNSNKFPFKYKDNKRKMLIKFNYSAILSNYLWYQYQLKSLCIKWLVDVNYTQKLGMKMWIGTCLPTCYSMRS